MEQKQTLYDYLHHALVQQIVSGTIAYGEKLPALRTLCDMYHVGIRTVRDVVGDLEKEGYVEAIQRSHIRVIYRTGTSAQEQVGKVLARQDTIHALIKTQAYVMPHIYAHAAGRCTPALVRSCRRDIQGINGLSAKEQWRRSRLPLQRITALYHNSLLQDLCVDFDLYAQVTIVPGFTNPYQAMSTDVEAGLNALLDRFAQGDYDGVYTTIAHMYHTAAEAVTAYFQALRVTYPMEKPPQFPYHWKAEKGRLRTHMQVARSLIQKIQRGEYAQGSYLPTSGQLREAYHVSAYTVGKAIGAIEEIGLVQKTRSRGGYLVTHRNTGERGPFAHGGAYRLDAMTFLEALHLLALLSRGIAALGFGYMEQGKVEALAQKVVHQRVWGLPDSILAALVENQPYQPLWEIYEQLEKLVGWGSYFRFAYHDPAVLGALRAKRKQALEHLQNGEKEPFIEAFGKIYDSIFHTMQAALVERGVAEANGLWL